MTNVENIHRLQGVLRDLAGLRVVAKSSITVAEIDALTAKVDSMRMTAILQLSPMERAAFAREHAEVRSQFI